MIRPLTERDRHDLVALLSAAPEYNLYLMGNVETLGFDQPFCRFWGDFGEGDLLRGTANRYMTGWGVYGQPDADWVGLAGLIDLDPEAERLQDNPGGIPSLLPLLSRHTASSADEEELMRLDADRFAAQPPPPGIKVRRATMDDLQALVAHYANAGEMRRSPLGVERPLRDGVIFVAEAADADTRTVVSSALTNAETRTHAMVGGVYTPEPWRGRGLSRAVCSALCGHLIGQGKQPVLYWKTPAAGRVYRTLGFTAIGTWRAVRLKPIAPDAPAA